MNVDRMQYGSYFQIQLKTQEHVPKPTSTIRLSYTSSHLICPLRFLFPQLTSYKSVCNFLEKKNKSQRLWVDADGQLPPT